MSRAVWQISGGPTSRSYAEVFLKHGVALIGPGDAEPMAYANLARLKQPAADLFARMQRP
ncbi:MAG: hypothetical protein A2X50_05095 [Candidatus Rokubacteria bacterium GWF2_70_14]|nr:MAG: hypothetical protein A2X50_05095 [Candidatus Rokubacteria bacterium GWF2_70_14]